MAETKNVKIAVAYHRESWVVSDRVLTPVLAGSAVSTQPSKDGRIVLGEDFLSRMKFRDDFGENISTLNRAVNEMSVVYWVWKNYERFGNPTHVGLAHYRRLFVADLSRPLPRRTWFPKSHMHCYDSKDVFLRATSGEAVTRALSDADVLVPFRYDASLARRGHGLKRCRDRFVQLMHGQKGPLYDEMERLVLAAHPDLAPEVEYLASHADHYVCNMFVLPREVFFGYCEFLFPILFRLVELNEDETDPVLRRAPGFLSEFLTSIFLSHIVRTGGLRVRELPLACWGISRFPRLCTLARLVIPDGLRNRMRMALRG